MNNDLCSGVALRGFIDVVIYFLSVPNSAPVAQPQQPAKPTPKNRRPEELDALAAQLNDLGAPSNPPGVEDDDSDDDSAAPPASDGTLLASEPPKPL